MNKTVARALVVIGWVLSPLTWWNDLFVNMPLAYLAASAYHHFFPGSFTEDLLVCYWLTNVAGIFLMYVGGKGLFARAGRREQLLWVLAVAAYSVFLAAASTTGLIRPLAHGQ